MQTVGAPTEPGPIRCRDLGMRASSLTGLLIAAALALLAHRSGQPRPVAYGLDGIAAPDVVSGTVLDSGAPLWSAEPTSLGCLLGCPAGHTPAPGSPVTIACRSDQGYLRLAGDPGVWVFAADVHAADTVPPC